jgi:integrase
MARTVRNSKIDTPSARAKITARREPYWTAISRGCAVGYRRGVIGGTWVARIRDEAGRQHYQALGAADDAREADGITVFNYGQAQARAREFFKLKIAELAGDYIPEQGPFTVQKALDAYFAERERRGAKGLSKDISAARLRIIPSLGDIEVAKITTRRLREWHGSLVNAAKLSRAGILTTRRNARAIDMSNPEAVRRRRSSANRILTILKAALNQAFHEGRVTSDEAWRKVKPFREADTPVVRFLTEDECRRLVNACDGAFRNLVRAALLTGCRYGELIRMVVSDFNYEAGTVTVRHSKAGKPRHVVLTDEGRELFSGLCVGRSEQEIFARDDEAAWKASHQQRRLQDASEHAGIRPSATFHNLRHTYASSLAMRGVPMGVIAAQLGHSSTRMTEKHYAHLTPNYVADTVRAALPSLGIVKSNNVKPIRSISSATVTHSK